MMHLYQPMEAEWIEGCRRGENRFQELVFKHYSPKMLAVCRRFLRERAEAEDALVSAFTRIFDRISDFRGEGSFEGWIRRIVVNQALMALRRKKISFQEIRVADDFMLPEVNAQPDGLEAEELLELIHSLPDGYRAVFNLYALEGFSHQEISEALGIDVNTSKSQLSRARKWLRQRLSLYGHEFNSKRTDYGSAD